MTMNRQEFTQKYPSLGPALGEFYDSTSADDEQNARSTRRDLPENERAQLLQRVLADAHRLMSDIDNHWEGLAHKANRQLYSRDQARDWLVRIMTAWQEELTRLRGGPASKD